MQHEQLKDVPFVQADYVAASKIVKCSAMQVRRWHKGQAGSRNPVPDTEMAAALSMVGYLRMVNELKKSQQRYAAMLAVARQIEAAKADLKSVEDQIQNIKNQFQL